MARQYMRVVVTNESGSTLRLRHATTTGEWTPGGWSPAQTPAAPPGTTVAWQAEGDSLLGAVAVSGVEARAWYDVVDPSGAVVGDFYVFVNSPLIESPYGNRFHVRAPAGYATAYVDADGQKRGNRSELEIAFRDTRKVTVPGFTPSVNGFAFGNSWSKDLPVVTLGWVWNRVRDAMQDDLSNALGLGWVPEDWLPITNASAGLCGGMTYTAIDYHLAKRIPDTPRSDADGMFVAPDREDDPLFRHIRDRLLESFDVSGRGSRWVSYSSPIYPDGDEGVVQAVGLMKGRAYVTYREEWPRIRRELDEGRLAPLGLVQSTDLDIGANHQVLAYAYEQSGQVVKLWIYDPNVPGRAPSPAVADDLYLQFDITDTSNPIRVSRRNAPAADAAKRIHAILYMDAYRPHHPPGGTALPPPGRPRVVTLEVALESVTTGGTVTSETTNPCGEPKRTGVWTSRTTASFAAQVSSGFVRPTVSWRVGETDVVAGSAVISATGHAGPVTIDSHLAPGGRVLSLSSRSGESFRMPVVASVSDADGHAVAATEEFEVSGTYEGLKIEDLVAEVRCHARNIPSPAEFGWKPPSPTGEGGDGPTIPGGITAKDIREETLKIGGVGIDDLRLDLDRPTF